MVNNGYREYNGPNSVLQSSEFAEFARERSIEEFNPDEMSRFLKVYNAFLNEHPEYWEECLPSRVYKPLTMDPMLQSFYNVRFTRENLLPRRIRQVYDLNNDIMEGSQLTGLLALAFDVDHFKYVNDLWGHPAGDYALFELQKIITANLRTDEERRKKENGNQVMLDQIARSQSVESLDPHTTSRMGGEEFLALLAGPMNLEDASNIAERLRSRVDEYNFRWGEDEELPVTCSFGGILIYPKGEYTEETIREMANNLIKTADKRLYYSKKTGRNKVTIGGEHIPEDDEIEEMMRSERRDL